jgi:tRNA modification GTPase
MEALSGTEIYLDYSEDEFMGQEDDEAKGRLPGRALVEQAAVRLRVLAENWRRERIYTEGALVALAGRANAGKSSLFNYLLREDRSIVTDTPGTTRDWIEALISVEDIPLHLADTAGLRNFAPEQPALKENSEAEYIGIRRTLELLDRADLVLYVIDGLEGITKEDREFLLKRKETKAEQPILILWNKTDLVQPPLNEGELLAVSAKTGEGIPSLTHSIAALLEASGIDSELHQEAPGTLRQKELIEASLASIKEALALADQEEPLDIIAPLFRFAINALGEITGEVSVPDILNAMFSRFCVGK